MGRPGPLVPQSFQLLGDERQFWGRSEMPDLEFIPSVDKGGMRGGGLGPNEIITASSAWEFGEGEEREGASAHQFFRMVS